MPIISKQHQITTTKHLLRFAELVIQTEIMMTKQLTDVENKKRYKLRVRILISHSNIKIVNA